MIDSFDPHAAYSLLRADLGTLFKLVVTRNKPCDEGDIRAASTILRRWLVEGMLGRMANALGVVPTLWVMNNAHVLDAIKADNTIRYFLTGGVNFDGKPVTCIYQSSAEPSEIPRLPIHAGLAQVAMSPSEMLRQKRIFYADTFFSCEDIIKFMANKLGGVHLDFQRDAHFDKLESASNFMSFGGPLEKMGKPPPGELYFDFEPNSKEILSGIHIEIIAAAASLLSIEFNGSALLKIAQKPSFRGRVKKALRISPKFRASLYEVRVEDDQCS